MRFKRGRVLAPRPCARRGRGAAGSPRHRPVGGDLLRDLRQRRRWRWCARAAPSARTAGGLCRGAADDPARRALPSRRPQLPALRALREDAAIAAVTQGSSTSPRRAAGADPARPDYVAGAVLDESGFDIDVDALLGLPAPRAAAGAQLVTDIGFEARIERAAGLWRVHTRATACSGAGVSSTPPPGRRSRRRAGVATVGLQPLARTVVIVPAPLGRTARWPMVIDVDERFYFARRRPPAASPANGDPSRRATRRARRDGRRRRRRSLRDGDDASGPAHPATGGPVCAASSPTARRWSGSPTRRASSGSPARAATASDLAGARRAGSSTWCAAHPAARGHGSARRRCRGAHARRARSWSGTADYARSRARRTPLNSPARRPGRNCGEASPGCASAASRTSRRAATYWLIMNCCCALPAAPATAGSRVGVVRRCRSTPRRRTSGAGGSAVRGAGASRPSSVKLPAAIALVRLPPRPLPTRPRWADGIGRRRACARRSSGRRHQPRTD